MNDERAPQVPRSYFRWLGRKGGSVSSPAKREASRQTLARARQVRLDRLAKSKTANPKKP